MKSKKFKVISVGSAMRDVFILNKDIKCPPGTKVCHPFEQKILGEKINLRNMYFDIGGGGTNTAATFANMGFKVALVSRIGGDPAGSEVIRTMKTFGVNTNLVEVDKKGQTGYSVIFINHSGERTALVFRGAADFNQFKKLKLSKLSGDWFFITSVNGNLELLNKIFDVAKKKNIKIGWNPGNQELKLGAKKLKKLLYETDVLLLNLKEAQGLIGLKTENIKKVFNKLTYLAPNSILCITAGQKGAWVKQDKKLYEADILDKVVVNATGAGDAFGSGFVSGLMLYKNNIKKALQLAMLNSNRVVTGMGAKHGLLKKPSSAKQLNRIKIKKL